jgi:hypothetical protein
MTYIQGMEYKFNGKISLEDFILFQKYYLKRNVFGGWKKIFYILFSIFLVILTIYHVKEAIFYVKEMVNTIPQLDPMTIVLIIVGIFGEFPMITPILFLFLFILLFAIFFNRHLRKYYYSNKFYLEEQHYIFTENQIEIKTDSSCIIITKDKINKILYNKKNVYIFVSLNIVYVIPESFLGNNDFMEFKCFLEKYY